MDKYKQELKRSQDYDRKIELAQKLVSYKLRSEEENGRN